MAITSRLLYLCSFLLRGLGSASIVFQAGRLHASASRLSIYQASLCWSFSARTLALDVRLRLTHKILQLLTVHAPHAPNTCTCDFLPAQKTKDCFRVKLQKHSGLVDA